MRSKTNAWRREPGGKSVRTKSSMSLSAISTAATPKCLRTTPHTHAHTLHVLSQKCLLSWRSFYQNEDCKYGSMKKQVLVCNFYHSLPLVLSHFSPPLFTFPLHLPPSLCVSLLPWGPCSNPAMESGERYKPLEGPDRAQLTVSDAFWVENHASCDSAIADVFR